MDDKKETGEKNYYLKLKNYRNQHCSLVETAWKEHFKY